MNASRSTLLALAIAGASLVVLGVFVSVAAWPSHEAPPTDCLSLETGEPVVCEEDGDGSTGSQPLAVLGLVGAGVGTLTLLVSVIGWGVMLGNRASRDSHTSDA